MPGEAREHPRAMARVKVEYHFGTTTNLGHTSDLSEGGMFLACRDVAPPGTRVYLRLFMPGSHAGEPLKIIGFVTRAVNAGETGMGIHFEVAYARTREQLADFLANLRAAAAPPAPIKALSGGEARGFSARFPDPPHLGYQRLPSLRPPEVDRVFAFDAPDAPQITWNRIASLVLKLVVVAALVGAVGYLLLSVSSRFAGAR
jgi:hypothetical protein